MTGTPAVGSAKVNIRSYAGPETLGLAPGDRLADGAFARVIGKAVPLTDDAGAAAGTATVGAVLISEDRRSIHIDLAVDLHSGGEPPRGALRRAAALIFAVT
jgi:hypothetical protein